MTSQISSLHLLLLFPKYLICIPERWRFPWQNPSRSRGGKSAFWLWWFSTFFTEGERQGMWIVSREWRKNNIWVSFQQYLFYWKLFSNDSRSSWKVVLTRCFIVRDPPWLVCWMPVVGNGVKFHAGDQSAMEICAYNLRALNVPSVSECENRLVVLNWA